MTVDVDSQDHASGVDRRALIRTGGGVALGLLGVGAIAAPPAAATGFGYTPVSPYRTFDSRHMLPRKLVRMESVDFDVLTDLAGVVRIPTSATAVTFNLTITETEEVGWLQVWPGGEPPQYDSPFSTINWSGTGQALANGGTVGLGLSPISGVGSIVVGWYPYRPVDPGATHFIVDITGYYS